MDDDTDNLELFSIALEEYNESILVKYNLTMYNEGTEFINHLKEHKPIDALIFLDINMPKKNGFEILEEIKQDAELSSLPVIMFSSASDTNSILISQQLGASLYAIKPPSVSGIIDLIKKVLTIKWVEPSLSNQNFLIDV